MFDIFICQISKLKNSLGGELRKKFAIYSGMKNLRKEYNSLYFYIQKSDFERRKKGLICIQICG